ncbi:MAG: hypothetical protein AAFR04_13470 [Pseudomonadota bacterium]
MPASTVAARVLRLAQVIHGWLQVIAGIEAVRRRRVAHYADEIAGTLGRAGAAFQALQADPDDGDAKRTALRELGRIRGYVEDLVHTLDARVDGRKLAGVKRRLAHLALSGVAPERAVTLKAERLIGQLAEAEGYFQALSDGLQV